MLVSDFDYALPPESIAQQPLADRAGSRLLHLNRRAKSWTDGRFRDFPGLLRPDDLLVLNNTRVFPARLFGRRSGERALPRREDLAAEKSLGGKHLSGQIEVLLTRQLTEDPNEWECLVRPGKKIGVGEKLYFGVEDTAQVAAGEKRQHNTPRPQLEAEVTARGEFGERHIRFAAVPDFFARLDRIGQTPLPPYIHRDDADNNSGIERDGDRDRYQTVYAQARGSVAAPTAGLHFTPEILDQIRKRGIEIAEVTLHVGLGTFQPIRVEKVEDHKLHREFYEISAGTARAINRAKAEGRRVVAVGTTTVRTLEYAAGLAAPPPGEAPSAVAAGQGEAEAFIYPGYKFRMVDAMLTNFHLPQSTLLMLVCALGGQNLVMDAYRHGVEAGYRFYSYGDCMFVE